MFVCWVWLRISLSIGGVILRFFCVFMFIGVLNVSNWVKLMCLCGVMCCLIMLFGCGELGCLCI